MTQARASRLDQIKIYTGKCFRIFINEHGFKSFISAAIIALIISWVAGESLFSEFDATQSGAFALICGCIWIGIFNSIQSICRERAIIKREYRTGLHISSYVTAHVIYETVICFVEALIVTVILFLVRGMPDEGIIFSAPIEIFITFFLAILSADILAMIVSSIVKNETAAMTVMPFVLILQLVMSGVIFKLDSAAEVVANLTISKWGVHALCSIADVLSMSGASLYLESDPAITTNYEYSASHLLEIWAVLLLFVIIYSLICVVALKFVDKDKR